MDFSPQNRYRLSISVYFQKPPKKIQCWKRIIYNYFFSIENNVLTTNGSKINIYERNNQLMQLVEKTSDPI